MRQDNQPYQINLSQGLYNIPTRKATGIDNVPGEWLRINKMEKNEITTMKIGKLHKIFKEWLDNGYIPDFWMTSKIVLISKENNNNPKVQNTRQIAILPSITKAFETSILINLEKVAFEDKYISENQRGFTPKKSTSDNIVDLFNFWLDIKNSNTINKQSVIIFIDLKRAYDWVNRNKLLKLLTVAKVPGKIVRIIIEMFSKSRIEIGNETALRTTRGLQQGSWLSPLLFNFYINPLLRELEKDSTWVRAYADDIIIVLKDAKEIDLKLKIVLDWCDNNDIKLNPEKSGVMRLLKRSGKIKGIKNIANIPEVLEYKYLGLTINQSLNFNAITTKIKVKTRYWTEMIRKIRSTKLSPKARKILLKTIYYQLITYGCTTIYPISNKYRRNLNSSIYRLTKQIYGISGNPSKEKLYQVLNLPTTEEMIRKRIEKQKSFEGNRNMAIIEDYHTPTVLNFVLGTTANWYKWRGVKWIWGKVVEQMHLIKEWPDFEEWRKHTNLQLNIGKREEIIMGITNNSDKWQNWNIKIIEQLIKEFNCKMREIFNCDSETEAIQLK